MPAFAEFFLANRTTSATDLAGISWVDKQHFSTSVCSFVGTELLEHRPTSIDNTFVQSAFGSRSVGEIRPILILLRLGTFAHVGGLQFHKGHQSVGVDQEARGFVQEVTALVCYFSVSFSNLLDSLLSTGRATFLACKCLLQALLILLSLAIVARVLYRASIRERSEMQQAQINPYCLTACFQGFVFHLTGKHDIPALTLAFNG